MHTTTTTNEATALRCLELISRGDTGPAVDEVIHPESVSHQGGREPIGRDGFRGVVGWLNAAFADIAFTPQDVLSDGDRVVARTTFRALHVGDFQGVAPTNRTIEFAQIHIWRLEDGLVAEHWVCMDELSGFRQMGVPLPPAG